MRKATNTEKGNPKKTKSTLSLKRTLTFKKSKSKSNAENENLGASTRDLNKVKKEGVTPGGEDDYESDSNLSDILN